MIINSELPNELLYLNNELNEYDFVLFHLYEKNKKYRNFYQLQREQYPDRLMILDNSAYEYFIQGKELDLNKYLKVINELKPDMYILPDVLMDKQKTLKGTKDFLKKYSKNIEYSQPLAVAQGKTEKELIKCLEEYEKLGIINIAIPFHNSFFKEYPLNQSIADTFMKNSKYVELNEDHNYAMGRVQFMMKYKEKIRNFKHVHLLGSHCPLEKIYYHDFDTMDTAYPVKCGMEGKIIFRESKKPNIIIDDIINNKLQSIQKLLCIDNVSDFKNL